MIDIHSHIIPGIDDGSKDMQMTIEMLRKAEGDGTKQIIATPHYLLEYGEAVITEVKELVKEINLIINDEGLDLKVYSGQEVYYTEKIIQNYIDGKIGTLNDSKYMLIEFPMREFDDNIFNVIYELQVRGITPIIAHPERYKPIIQKPLEINQLINEGYLFQINVGSLEGKFGNSVRKTAEILLKHRIYNFIGSDAHDTTNRTTGLSSTVDLIRNYDEDIEKIFEDSSGKILNNEEIDFCGQRIKEKKSIFSFFKK